MQKTVFFFMHNIISIFFFWFQGEKLHVLVGVLCIFGGRLSPCRQHWPMPGRKCHSHIQPCEPHPRRICWRWWRQAGWSSASHWQSWHWWCPALYTALSAPPLHFQSVNAHIGLVLSLLKPSTHISLSSTPVLRTWRENALDEQKCKSFLVPSNIIRELTNHSVT